MARRRPGRQRRVNPNASGTRGGEQLRSGTHSHESALTTNTSRWVHAWHAIATPAVTIGGSSVRVRTQLRTRSSVTRAAAGNGVSLQGDRDRRERAVSECRHGLQDDAPAQFLAFPAQREAPFITVALALDRASKRDVNSGRYVARNTFIGICSVSPPSVPPSHQATLHAFQEWERHVVEVGDSDFVARRVDLTAGRTPSLRSTP